MNHKKTNILIVDDEPILRATFSAILCESGYRVRSSSDGFSALAEIDSEIPDILLTDLDMPGMSGFELLAVVRRRFPGIRLIAMSGVTMRNWPPDFFADAFYGKGGRVSRLLNILESMFLPAAS